MSRPKTRLMFRQNIMFGNVAGKLIIGQSFKQFCNDRDNGDWTIVIDVTFVSLFSVCSVPHSFLYLTSASQRRIIILIERLRGSNPDLPYVLCLVASTEYT